ncbi:MAG: cell division protein ZipA [Pseudohongiella sp.]|nr:cell division protein ZipA [Pseudohongiella sp.]
MGLTELLILVFFLVVVAVILRVLVAGLRSRKNKIRIALEKNIPVYDLDELELRELPNGGARMVQRSFEEVMRQAAELESLDTAKKRPRSKVLKTDLTREAVLARRAAALAATEAAIARGEVVVAPDLFHEPMPANEACESVAAELVAEEQVAAELVADEPFAEELVAEEQEAADRDHSIDDQPEITPPLWAAAAVRADEYRSTLVQRSSDANVNANDLADDHADDHADDSWMDNEWLDDVSPVREVQVACPAFQEYASAAADHSGESQRPEPTFSSMRFDDELGLVSHDEPDIEEPEIEQPEIEEPEIEEPEIEEPEDEDPDDETADYFLDSAVDDEDEEPSAEPVVVEADVFALDSFSSTEGDEMFTQSGFENKADEESERGPEQESWSVAALDDAPHFRFELHDQELPGQASDNQESYNHESYNQESGDQQADVPESKYREPEELDDVLDELLNERGVSTDVDYSRAAEPEEPEPEYQPPVEPEYQPAHDPEPEPEEIPEEAPEPEPEPEESPIDVPEYQPPYTPVPAPEPEIEPPVEREPEELPEEVPEPDSAPEYEPAHEPDELPEPEPEPEELPEPEPEELPVPEYASVQHPDEDPEDEEEPLPDFDSELEAEPEPQPQPVDSFAAVENKDDIDDLFKDEDQQRRIEALEQEAESAPKKFMSWAGAAIGKFTSGIAESRARAAEEKAVRDELAREQAELRAQQKADQHAQQQAHQKAQQQARQEQQEETARRVESDDDQDPLADYAVDDEQFESDDYQPALSGHDEYEEEFAAHNRDDPGFDKQEAEPVVTTTEDKNISRYGESPYKQHQFGHAPAGEAAATAASATAAASAAKSQPKPAMRSARENQLTLEMPAEDTLDSGFSQVLVINVMARPNSSINGDELLPALLAAGLRFGDMSIFHRHADRRGGPVLFSVANALNPGTFDLNEISNFSTQGVTFFMTLPNVANNMLAFEQMLATARHVQSALDADLKDDNRSVMTAQTVEHYRQRIRDFELQQLKNSRQK